MKKLAKILLAFTSVIFLFSLATSCRDDDENNNSGGNNTVASVTNIATSGTWRISYFNDSGNVETDHFNGYNFTFGSGNVLTATNGSNTYTGTWSVTDSNSNDDNPNDLHFNIAFSAPDDFTELTEDWNIISKSNTEIQLRHISGGNGGTDLLTFVKN